VAGEGDARAHVFVPDLAAPRLDSADHHHLTRVLRLRPGDAVTVTDGAGGWRRCRLADDGGETLAPAGAVEHRPRAQPLLTVAFALTKGERPEWVVQKLTEAGVDRIVPFAAARSVVRWDGGRADRNVERLRRVAREAAMQSRRAWLPEVGALASFAQVAALDGAALAERAGAPPSLARPTLLVGPEGGWADEEREAGLARVGLGPFVLRADTAALAAGLLLSALRDGLVAGSGPNGLP